MNYKGVVFLLICILTLNVYSQQTDSTIKKAERLLELKFIEPMRKMHSDAAKAIQSAYVSNNESFKYDFYQKPTKKTPYYEGEVLEYENQFIKKKYPVRVYIKKDLVEVMDANTKKYLNSESWLKSYRVGNDKK